MFIAFEGPDKTGKSTSANSLAASGVAIYNARKDTHELMQKEHEAAPELPITYDRIDWLTHMVYRLAMPTHEWNDARVRTVFAMPDTHLVFKLHDERLVEKIDDELYDTGKLVPVNRGYMRVIDYLTSLNLDSNYSLFKTISIVKVSNDPRGGSFSQRLVSFDSPVFPFGTVAQKLVDSDEKLLELLRYEESQR
ncbi:thymidylate kinase [Microbacterium phage Pikmin]|uniref:AAA-ATPase n=3 Tax=Pikminvirus pikmin TaxID=2560596 RepID=A0A2P1CKK5_9CAUD|nr:thymidylate kinase [Microbacterium phage Pikmin]AVJ51035.1 AAA-ATPase [Microbacterium phage Pajaza]AVJ51182.1 AAA-ATPase [Microbacterium phage Pikmin]AVJ51740.1 AAA-ATPase [Microbacterium phage Casey]